MVILHIIGLQINTQQNLWNSNGKKRYYPKGVYEQAGKYISMIRVNKKQMYLGRFKSVKEASMAYIEASKKFHGKYSIYNRQ